MAPGRTRCGAAVATTLWAGGAGDDTYAFNTNAALGADGLTDSAGIDRLYFTGSTAGVTVDLGQTAQQTLNANLKLRGYPKTKCLFFRDNHAAAA